LVSRQYLEHGNDGEALSPTRYTIGGLARAVQNVQVFINSACTATLRHGYAASFRTRGQYFNDQRTVGCTHAETTMNSASIAQHLAQTDYLPIGYFI
jgi:hypothetical protein